MKNKFILTAVLVCFAILSLLAGCGSSETADDLWTDAMYTEDTELGDGVKTIIVTVETEEKSVVFTVHTDANTLGDALTEHSLISGEEGPYGLYIKRVNGILADYDINKSYWSLEKDEEYLSTGVDATDISDGDIFELIYTK